MLLFGWLPSEKPSLKSTAEKPELVCFTGLKLFPGISGWFKRYRNNYKYLACFQGHAAIFPNLKIYKILTGTLLPA